MIACGYSRALELGVWAGDEIGLAEGHQIGFEARFDGGDGICGLDFRLDLSIGIAVIQLVEMDSSLFGVHGLAAARNFFLWRKTKLKDDASGGRVICDGGFFNDVNTRIFDMTAEDEGVFWGLIYRVHGRTHNEAREVIPWPIAARDVNAIVLPVDGAKIEIAIREFVFERFAVF